MVNTVIRYGNLKISSCVILHCVLLIELFCLFAGKSREAEVKRINKELANIRSKFKGERRVFITNSKCISSLVEPFNSQYCILYRFQFLFSNVENNIEKV